MGSFHPMHIHGGPFQVVAVDGETLQPSARYMADTVNVGPGQRYDVMWKARQPGQVAHPLPHRSPHDAHPNARNGDAPIVLRRESGGGKNPGASAPLRASRSAMMTRGQSQRWLA